MAVLPVEQVLDVPSGTHPPQSVLVTGASRGIGRELAIALCAAGADVIGVGRDAEALAETAKRTEGLRGSFASRVVDVTDEAAVVELMASLPALDACVNNAGVAVIEPFLTTSLAELRRMLAVNVEGAFLVMREAGRQMAARGRGRIVNIASDAAYTAIATMSAYVASKHALFGLGRSASLELAAHGVQVMTVFPGWTRTEILGPELLATSAEQDSGMTAEDAAAAIRDLILRPFDSVVATEIHLQAIEGRR